MGTLATVTPRKTTKPILVVELVLSDGPVFYFLRIASELYLFDKLKRDIALSKLFRFLGYTMVFFFYNTHLIDPLDKKITGPVFQSPVCLFKTPAGNDFTLI
jgi:hypothetical protein